jgi:branched-chain amino acid transport system ATP-binding protein
VLKTVFGLVRPRAGDIRFEGRSIAGASPRDLLGHGLVFVPQGRNLFPTLTVRHNLELGGITMRDKALLKRRMDAVFARFRRLAERADRHTSALSGGEQKMLEIGRALLLEPRVLLVDEPSIGLAPKVIAEVFAILRDLVREGVTVVMVEQNVKSALAISDKAVALEQGRVAIEGPAQAVLADPRIGALFLGGHVAAAH